MRPLPTRPTKVIWLKAGGQQRTLTPPAQYVRELMVHYKACVAIDCGR